MGATRDGGGREGRGGRPGERGEAGGRARAKNDTDEKKQHEDEE